MPIKNRLASLMGEKQTKENKIINISDIHRATGLSRQTLHNWLDNDVSRFDESVVDSLCEYFNCDVGDLLYRVTE